MIITDKDFLGLSYKEICEKIHKIRIKVLNKNE